MMMIWYVHADNEVDTDHNKKWEHAFFLSVFKRKPRLSLQATQLPYICIIFSINNNFTPTQKIVKEKISQTIISLRAKGNPIRKENCLFTILRRQQYCCSLVVKKRISIKNGSPLFSCDHLIWDFIFDCILFRGQMISGHKTQFFSSCLPSVFAACIQR